MEEELKELETAFLELIKELDTAIDNASHVNQVISALHSVASLLFDVRVDCLPGKIDRINLRQIGKIQRWKIVGQEAFRHAFYRGFSFPTLAKLLVCKVASNWLACFPLSARTSVFDIFFLNAPPVEALEALVLGLAYDYSYAEHQEIDAHAVCSNAERILILCLVENEGLKKMAVDFGISYEVNIPEGNISGVRDMERISRMAQLVASIPDKARLESPKELSAQYFFNQITSQLLAGAQEKSKAILENIEISNRLPTDGTFIFIGGTFARICRRGHADIVAFQIVPRLLQHVRNCLDSNADMINTSVESVEKQIGSSFWQAITAAIKDSHAMERWTEALLRQMALLHPSDLEAYWMIWTLFDNICKSQASVRALFAEKFLLWKVFPICCLRWILQFAVFHCPPGSCLQGQMNKFQLDMVRHVVEVWAKREFVQSASMDQQAYITAAVGLSIEKMTKENLELSGGILHSLVQGVSCRLDSPINLVRKMASRVALTFSKVIDPNNPLFLDDDNCAEGIDVWEFGIRGMKKENLKITDHDTIIDRDNTKKSIHMVDDQCDGRSNGIDKAHGEREDSTGATSSKLKRQRKKALECQVDDPDEVIDLATLNAEDWSDEDDNESVESECPSESSLQPYNLSDDESDLRRDKFPSQLSDCVAALRKGDDPDAVERALDVTEKLVRAVPDELNIVAVALVRALVHVRCSAVAVEGQEESAEKKRHCALVALLVCCPLMSVEVLGKELYSPNVDVSQRLLILDVMVDAAQELSESRDLNRDNYVQQRKVLTVTEFSRSSSNPWYLPNGKITPPGAGPWKEVSETGTMVSWSHHYERELPSRSGDRKLGKSRRWGPRTMQLREKQLKQFEVQSKNRFPLYAAAFMLPVMRGYDKPKHGVDLLGRDFLVLGKLIYMLGICMECVALHPEASVLALPLLDMLKSRDISNHVEAYVRRAALFAASCILIALHPSYIATALSGDDHEIARGLEWIRSWALHVADADSDIECSTMAMACVQLHAEMALQAIRSMDSVGNCLQAYDGTSYNGSKSSIILPISNKLNKM